MKAPLNPRLTVAVQRSKWGVAWVYVVMVDAGEATSRFVYGYAASKKRAAVRAEHRASDVAKGLIHSTVTHG